MLVPGTCVHQWKVIQRLGEGRNGTLYAVERAGQSFVLKWLAPSRSDRLCEPPEVLCEREASCLRLLRGPLFVGLEAHGRWPQEEHGRPFLVLRSVEGMPLTRWYHQSGPTARDMAHVFMGIASALSEMHRQGVRYPGLASGDVMVRSDRLRPVLTDMGGALPRWGAVTSEEAAEDLRAVGVMLYEALTRQSPAPNALPPHVVNPRVPQALSEVAMNLLAPGPGPGLWV